jgi:hypothetical protein
VPDVTSVADEIVEWSSITRVRAAHEVDAEPSRPRGDGACADI